MTHFKIKVAGVGAAAALLAVTPAIPAFGGQIPQDQQGGLQDASTAQMQPAVLLTSAIRSEIKGREVTGAPADLEALIVFVISQGDNSDAVISNALDMLSVNASDNLRIAIGNVRLALLRGNKRGTAAIVNLFGGSGSAGSGGGEFTAPGISTGGGSSNYS